MALLTACVLLRAVAGLSSQDATSIVRPWDSFNGVVFVGPQKLYIVGASGAFLTSVDGGRTWNRRQLAQQGVGSGADLFSVQFSSNGLDGWITGERGLVLESTDGGGTWKRKAIGVAENLLRVAVLDAKTACVVGTNGTLVITRNAGATWESHRLKSGLTLFDVEFVDLRNGWAVGEFQTVLHTTDAGKTWQVQSGGKRADFESSPYFAVHFFDLQYGWVTAQSGVAWWTQDGGAHWTKLKLSSESSFFTITADTRDTGRPAKDLWIAGENGALMSIPVRNGSPLAPVEPILYRPSFYSLTDLAFAGTVGIAVGIEGTILRTENGGRNWEQIEQ
jgi:photosystem II stability/assembly factor-like uncharacterized protein